MMSSENGSTKTLFSRFFQKLFIFFHFFLVHILVCFLEKQEVKTTSKHIMEDFTLTRHDHEGGSYGKAKACIL